MKFVSVWSISAKMCAAPVPMPQYKVKQHWHERFNADPGNRWLRKTMMALYAGNALNAG